MREQSITQNASKAAWRKTRNLLALLFLTLLFTTQSVDSYSSMTTPNTTTTAAVPNDGTFADSVDACTVSLICSTTSCGSSCGTDLRYHWIRRPDTTITSMTFTATAGGTTCGGTTGGTNCGLRYRLTDNTCATPVETGGPSCTTAHTYAQVLWTNSGTQTNNVLQITNGVTFGTSASTTITLTGTFHAAHTLTMSLDYSAKTLTFTYDGGAPVTTAAGTGTLTGSGYLLVEGIGAGGTGLGDTTMTYSGVLTGILPTETPTAPAQISAVITSAQPSCQIELRWTVSSNDPDPTQGDYNYDVWVNGAFLSTDATTTQDADGIRYSLLSIGGVSPGRNDFKVRAQNVTTQEYSGFSPTVSVDCALLHDSDSANTGVGGQDLLPGGGAAGSTANPIGEVVSFADESWNVPAGTFGWLLGIAIITTIVFGCTRAERGQPFVTVFGAIAGSTITTILGLTQVWLILLIGLFGFITLAVVLFSNRSGGEEA